MARRSAVEVQPEQPEQNVRRFSYEVNLDDPHLQPITHFEGQWSRSALERMLKHATRGLKQYKRTLLKEARDVTGSSESSEYTITGRRSANADES